MKAFIILYDSFYSDVELLNKLNSSTNKILKFVCADAKDDLTKFCSLIEDRSKLEMAMTYVYGRHIKEIQSHFGYDIDLYNFLNKTVLDE